LDRFTGTDSAAHAINHTPLRVQGVFKRKFGKSGSANDGCTCSNQAQDRHRISDKLKDVQNDRQTWGRRANWLTFRRTFSAWSHKNGIPPKDIAELMGHADVDMQFETTMGTDENKYIGAAKLGKTIGQFWSQSADGAGNRKLAVALEYVCTTWVAGMGPTGLEPMTSCV
jgi:hypothetical protein